MPSRAPHDERAAGVPAMPSFAELRGPSRPSPVDELLSGPPRAVAPPPVGHRPPEWADLVHLAVHVVRWSVAVPLCGVRRLLRG